MLFSQITQTLPDLYDQQSLKLLFDYMISHKETKKEDK